MTKNQRIKRAARILKEGGLVAFPTETVYGLGADASNSTAVLKIYEAKERPSNNPLIVHLADLEQLPIWAKNIHPLVYRLAEYFWPGPLTLVLQKQPSIPEVVTGGQDTIAIRIPKHPIAQELLKTFGGGIAAPSANKFMRISPTHASAVKQELGSCVDMILDGGDCEVGLESTIIDMSGEVPALLRPGMLTTQAIERVLGCKLNAHSTQRAPGQHLVHYAPQTKTTILSSEKITDFLLQEENVGLVTLDELGSDPNQYAHNLYRVLRALDNQKFSRIIIEEVPATPEWEAIRDRISRACTKE